MTTELSPATPAADCCYLPSELWARILTHVDDDFDVWVTCRQVSRMLRAEAEREFAHNRLSKLDLRWRSHCFDSFNSNMNSTFVGRVQIEKPNLENFSENSRRAHFRFNITFALGRPGSFQNLEAMYKKGRLASYDYGTIKEQLLNPFIHTCDFTVSDLKFGKGKEHNYGSSISIDYRINEVEIPGLDIDFDTRKMSFEWEEFLNNFFFEEQYVRRNRQVSRPNLTDLMEQADNALKAKKYELSYYNFQQWLISNEQYEVALWRQAYQIRLERAGRRAGLISDRSEKDEVPGVSFGWSGIPVYHIHQHAKRHSNLHRDEKRRHLIFWFLKSRGYDIDPYYQMS